MQKLILFAVISISLFFTACKKNENTPKTEIPADVYVSGYDADTSLSYRDIPTVWNNGVPVRQSNYTNNTFALSVAVSGNDVYSTGYENGSIRLCKVWKNGTELYSFGDGEPMEGISIAVSGTDVHVAGHMYNPSLMKHYAVYFKNNNITLLTNGNNGAAAQGIAVLNNDVYICGYEGNEARLWKNGIVISLNNATDFKANAVALISNDVYVLGNSQTALSKIRLWKNGISTDITDGTSFTRGNAIAVTATDVYIAGTEISAGKAIAKVWKNGIATSLSDGIRSAYAKGIAIKGNDVYVAGDQNDTTGIFHYAMLWKNGIPTELGTKRSTAEGIAVK